jgi:hypothetical protein
MNIHAAYLIVLCLVAAGLIGLIVDIVRDEVKSWNAKRPLKQ